MLLRSAASGNKETQSTGSADRARLQEAVVTCVELLIAQYNPLDKFIVPHLHGALHLVIEIVEDALKPTATTNIDKRQLVLSREFYLLLYRRMMTALCGVAMYHAYNWTRTQNTGDGLVQVIYLIGELSTRIGHVHLCSYHADDERRYGVSLAQLMSDVVAMTQSGSPQHCKYSLGFPGSALLQRRHVIAVSRVQSAYQLMQDALEAQSRGSAITAASTDTYAQVMVPPLDQSARQWFGANTPSPTDVQADTLHPQQVVQAGAELYSALCLHTTAFPLTITDSSSGTSLEITDGTTAVEVSMAAEHTAHFLVGNGATAVSSTRRQQVLSVHTEALRGDVVHVQVGSAVESSGWTLQPAQQCLTGPNTSLKDTSVVTKQLVVTRQVGVLEPTLDLFLDDFRSTRLPPAELLQTQNSITSDWNEDVKEATVEHNSAIIAAGLTLLAVPRKSSAGSLVDFKKAAPPTTSKNAPVPRSELNHAFSFLHSIGAVDGLEPLVQQRTFSKFGANINDGDNGSTVVTLTKPGVHWDAVVPSEVYVPLAPRSLISSVVASTAATDATSGLANASSVQLMLQQQDLTPNDDAVAALHAVHTRTLIPPLPCLARTSAGSRTTVTKLQEAVYRAFGTLNDDGTSSRACTSRHELVLLDASSLDHAFTRSDAVLFFAGNFSDVLAATRDVRQLLAGRSFAALFVVPNPVVANGVTIHLARQGEGAPLFSPIVDGACLSVESAGLLLRAALLSSMLPWKQPLTIAEAKRRVSQRPTRTFLMDGLATKDVNQLLSSVSTKRAAGRSASPRPASGASPLSTVVTSTSGPSPSPHSQQSSPGPNNNNSSFAGNNNSLASVARFVSPGQDASTMTATAWTLQLAASGW
ncbi:Hypothetical protein, putative [Bodo saltans]|uniref:Uncharacterized protein n=1 Tax=Bodo saltans TaxID=75058 RepID=A0A0S4IN54_BODSA|nr:Hypothetical protein, putative [Bodo saltans]|eukprot:CUF60763.1 Hypothetical protein, putative [Bodo saltans]